MPWSVSGLLPHSICLSVDPFLLWLHTLSDAVTMLSYYSIPIALFVLVIKRRDLEFRHTLILFASFVLACGTTHFLDIVTLWYPVYLAQGLVKALTAGISLATAIALWLLLPRAITWPSPQAMQREIGERLKAEARLLDLMSNLEMIVRERTSQMLAEQESRRMQEEKTRSAELRLADSEGRFRAAQEAALDGFAIYEPLRDKAGRIRDFGICYANPVTLAYANITAQEICRKTLCEQFPGATEPGGLLDRLVEVAESGNASQFEVLYRDAQLEGWFRNKAVRIGSCIAVTFSEITVEMRSRQREEEVTRAKSEFFASASHDLRQPLQAMRLFVDVIAELNGDPRIGRAVAGASQALNSAEGLVHSLLDVARIEAGLVNLVPRPFLLDTLFHRIRTEFDGLALGKGLRLRIHPAGLAVRSDPQALERILRNLVTNAIRYTSRGGILIGCRARGKKAVIEIWDTGKGIPADKIESIWEEFIQLDNPARDRNEGLGLGLAIVKRLAQELGHNVTVKSRPGRGTVFRIGLAACSAAELREEEVLPPIG